MAGNQACSCSPRSCRNILWTAISYLPISSGQRREIREAAQKWYRMQNTEYRIQNAEVRSRESRELRTRNRKNGESPTAPAPSASLQADGHCWAIRSVGAGKRVLISPHRGSPEARPTAAMHEERLDVFRPSPSYWRIENYTSAYRREDA